MKRMCLLFFMTTIVGCVFSQQLDTSWQREFTEHVKSMDEFMKRFNGEEAYPGLDVANENFLRMNLFSLLDNNMDETLKQKVSAFISAIQEDNVKLNYADTLWYVEAKCAITYRGKPAEVTLFLRTEQIRENRYRWVFCGADGINGKLMDTESKRAISPVEHEIYFLELQSIFKNDKDHIWGYRENGYKIDQLSVFLALVYSGYISFNYISDMKFVFFNVPNYVFTVEEIGRRGANAGWLITSFKEIPQSDKKKYINNLIKK